MNEQPILLDHATLLSVYAEAMPGRHTAEKIALYVKALEEIPAERLDVALVHLAKTSNRFAAISEIRDTVRMLFPPPALPPVEEDPNAISLREWLADPANRERWEQAKGKLRTSPPRSHEDTQPVIAALGDAVEKLEQVESEERGDA